MRPTPAAERAGPPPERDTAFTALYTNTYPRVLAYARRRCSDEGTARDIAAETFTTAWRRLPEAISGGLPWLFTTAGLHLRNHQRIRNRAHATTARLAAQPATITATPPTSSSGTPKPTPCDERYDSCPRATANC